MKPLALCVISIQLCLSAFCQNNFVTITGHIKGLQPGEWVYYEKKVGGSEADSAATQDGGFAFRIMVPRNGGNEYMLRIGKSIENAKPVVLLYLEKGNVTIESEDTSFQNVSCKGPQSLEDYQNWCQMRIQFMHSEEADSVYAKRMKLELTNDIEGLATLQLAIKRADSLGLILDTQWVHQHRTSPISAYVLYENQSNLSPEELETEMNSLPAISKNNVFADYITSFINEKIHDASVGTTAAGFT